MNTLVESLWIALPLSILMLLAGIYLGGEIWAKGKVVLGDILSFFGWAGTSIRKASVRSEYEGTINSIIQDYNRNFENPILPKCKLEWVTPDNQRNILKENEAIICLSFDKKDHNLNFYNATLNFVQTGLIAKAKGYLTKPSSKAIDLLATHIILRNNRKEVLTTFRAKMDEFDDPTKTEFEILAPTHDRGLFLNILLPEFHFYGELVNTLPPSSEFNIEANGLLTWFKELATREFDERTNLKYISKNFKVGVILVGKDETWESQGPAAYTKWADYYASENFNSVYVLARRSLGFERASTVTKILTETKGFDQLNRNPKIKCASPDGKEYIVTCYSLRPNRTTMIYLAWENLKSHYAQGKVVPAIVDGIQKDQITVNAFGLKIEIPNKLLSEIEIVDARKVFQPEDEVYLTITELDADKQFVVLSNRGTISDPKIYIDAVLKENKVYPCIVERVQTDVHGLQNGLKVSNVDLKSWIYVPRAKASPSRFLDLNAKFSKGTPVSVVIERYNSSTSTFIGSIENLIDPWASNKVKGIQPGDVFKVVVKQLNEFSIVCEIEEGIECTIARQEISWKPHECITSNYKIDDIIEVVLIQIDTDRRRIDASIKRLSKTPELEFFDARVGDSVDVEIVKVVPDKGIVVKYSKGLSTGFIHWFEIGWGSVGKFESLFHAGQSIKAVVWDFDADKNSIKFSIKRLFSHQFVNWVENVNQHMPLKGKVISHFENSAQIELRQNGFTVQGFIMRKHISNFAFVEKDDLQFFLPIGESFMFNVLEINEDRKTITLGRQDFLDNTEKVEYGDKITVRYVKENSTRGYFYSDEAEGWINAPDREIPLGTEIEVMPISHSSGEYEVV